MVKILNIYFQKFDKFILTIFIIFNLYLYIFSILKIENSHFYFSLFALLSIINIAKFFFYKSSIFEKFFSFYIWLGFFFFYCIHLLFFKHDYNFSIGNFDVGNATHQKELFIILIIVELAILISSIISSKYIVIKHTYSQDKLWLSKYSNILLFFLASSVLIISFLNINFKFFDYYYFNSPLIYWILIIPFSSSLVLWIWSKAYSSDKGLSNYWALLFTIALFSLHFSLVHIYYPMNSGIQNNNNLSETIFIKGLSKSDRLLILQNEQNEVEKKFGNRTNFDNAIKLASVPEFSRYQSDINFRGNFFSTLQTTGVYTEGSNLTPKHLNNFHSEVIKSDKTISDKYTTNKGYLLVGRKSIESPLIDVAAVSHVASSLTINSDRLKLIHEGDQYLIYKNISAFPKYFLSNPEIIDSSYQALSDLDVGQDFYVPNMMNGKIKVNDLNGYSLDIESPVDSVLVISDLYHHGWSASLNDVPIDIFRVNYLFKGVKIPAGSHNLHMTFLASNFWTGVIISLISFAIILILLFRRIISSYRAL